MRMIKKILVFGIAGAILISLLLVSHACKKEAREVIVNGRITDQKLKTPLADVKVVLLANKIISGVYNNNFQAIASTTTDANGNYSMKITVEKVNKYQFQVNLNKYFDETIEIKPETLEAEDNYIFNYGLNPISWFKLRLHNILGWDDKDQIAYQITNGTRTGYECCSNQIQKAIGQYVDQTTNCRIPGNQKVDLSWYVTKKGITVPHQDSIYIAPFDTTYYYIKY